MEVPGKSRDQYNLQTPCHPLYCTLLHFNSMKTSFFLLHMTYVKLSVFFFCLFHLSEVMEVPGKPLSESNARKYFIDVVLGIEYCKWDYVSKDLFLLHGPSCSKDGLCYLVDNAILVSPILNQWIVIYLVKGAIHQETKAWCTFFILISFFQHISTFRGIRHGIWAND